VRTDAAIAATVVLVASLTGCDGKPQQTTLTTATVSAGPTPTTGLRIADKAVTIKSRLAIGTEGEDALRLTLSSSETSCEQLRATYPGPPAPETGTRFDFWLNRPLEKTGSFGPWTFRSAVLVDGKGDRGLHTQAAQLDAVTSTEGRVTVKGLDLASLDGQRQVMWTGDLTAEQCPRVARKEQDRKQDKLTLTIAGKPMAIHGAVVAPKGDQHFLRLTRAPSDCDSVFTAGYDFYLDVVVKGDPPKLQFAALQGDIFPDDPSGSGGREDFVFETDGLLGGDETVAAKLAGKLDLRGYEVVFKGSVEAIRCAPFAK